ncbi:MAG: BON domain-containing protein [Leptolyngbya sp. DLM2.Bin15]|nr:MAG: BON domain-containing protein [Leptolyngbya sp. DLM2.Bin15]
MSSQSLSRFCKGHECLDAQDTSALNSIFFTSIPPERIGLNGDYDHNGLSKRVSLALSEQFSPSELQDLHITQRGAVVVLTGNVETRSLLEHITQVAQAIHGATEVETLGVLISDPVAEYSYLPNFSPFSSSSYAY